MTKTATTTRRRTAAAVGALVLLVPATASAAPADPPTPVPLDAVCADVPAEVQPFADVAPTSNVATAIRCQAHAGITKGVGPYRYDPGRPVTRAQMASFVARMLDTAAEHGAPSSELVALPAFQGTSPFTDVASGSAHETSIARLADAGIVVGGPGSLSSSSYGPGLVVTREQMATFLARAMEHLAPGGSGAAPDAFTDDEQSIHQDAINAVADKGIAVGAGAGRFEPALALRRDQMAAFLMRTLAHLEQEGQITPLPAGEPIPYQRCVNDAGFAISYPSTWHTDGGCTWFHPHPFEVPVATDGDFAANSARVEPMPFQPGDPGQARNVVRTDLVIDGHQAVKHEYESEDGLWPDGTPIASYVVDVGQVEGRESILVVDTIGLDKFDFELNEVVLDRMATTIEILEDEL